jgi:hypothetical protein
MTKRNAVRALFAALLLVALSVYAVEQNSGPKRAFYSFDFGVPWEGEGIEVLNYKYGNSKIIGPDWEVAKNGHIAQGTSVSGRMRVEDSLYVKWRVLSTGKVYEDSVDLKSRLPWHMDHKIIHFSIKGPQLDVYVVEGDDSTQLHAAKAPDCPIKLYKDFKCTRIYPDHWTNF